MSNTLDSFLVQAVRSTAAGDVYEGDPSGHTLPTGTFLSELAASQSTPSFLTDSPQVSNATFLEGHSTPQETILGLTASSSTTTFLSGAEADVGGGEEELLRSGIEGDAGEIGSGPLLYLDPATGLHVLVHHLPPSTQEASGPRVDDNSQEQFVVVGALRSDEEQVVLERQLDENPHSVVNVENLLRARVDSTGTEFTPHHIFASQLESTLGLNVGVSSVDSLSTSQTCKPVSTIVNIEATTEPIEDRRDSPSILDCGDAPMLTLRVTDEGGGLSTGDLQRDILGIEGEPHINLEEIIEKFTSGTTQHVIGVSDNNDGASDNDGVTGDIADAVGENTNNILSEITDHALLQNHKPSLEKPMEVSSEILPEENAIDVKASDADTSSTPHTSSRSENEKGRFLKLSSISENQEENDGSVIIDEESLYDIVMTYRCKVCAEVFVEKASLLQHYKEVHKPGGAVKIRVSTTSGSDQPLSLRNGTKSSTKKVVLPANIRIKADANIKKDLNILSCGICSKEFLSVQECRKHLKKEHPGETKRTRKAPSRPRNSQGMKTKYPSQPGMLIGHRKSRTYTQEDNEEKKTEGAEPSKRRVKAPKNLQEQYWLQKQKPKPVFLKEIERIFKCPVEICKYKFSTEENLQKHKSCHRNGVERVFICPECSARYDKWAMCQLHLWKAHQMDIDLLTCGICKTYKTPTEQRLVTHQMTHSDRRDHVCKTCGKSFRQQAQLLNHQVVHVANQSNRPAWAQKGCCPECKRWFTDKKAMKLHYNAVHMKVKPHACPHCSYRCSRKFDLNVHMRQHTGERPHKCELCGWQCRDHNALRRHKVVHLHMKPIKCPHDYCEFESRHTAYFKRHVSKKHPKSEAIYKCQICHMETPNLTEYITHSSNHEKELVKEAFKMRSDAPETKEKEGNPIEKLDDKGKPEEKEKKQADPLKKNENEVPVKEVERTENLVEHTNTLPRKPVEIKVEPQPMDIKVEAHSEASVVTTKHELDPETIVFETVTNTNDEQNTQVITIKLGNVDKTRESDESMSLLNPDNRLESYHKENQSYKVEDQSVMEDNSYKVQEHAIMDSNTLLESSPEGTVLSIVRSGSSEAALLSVDGDQTLMTLPQVVLSEDGHQYIIGITPDGLNATGTSIFTLQQTEEQQ